MKTHNPSLFQRGLVWHCILSMIVSPIAVQAQTALPMNVVNGQAEQEISLRFLNAPLDQVLDQYSRLTGKTLIKAPSVAQININLQSQTRLTETEALIAIETTLSLNNISFVPLGDKFLKVVQSPTAQQEAINVVMPDQAIPLNDSDHMVSQVIELKHTTIQEIQPIFQPLLHAYGKIQPLERSNALMVTDSAATIKQLLEMLEYIDRPFEVREEPRIYELKYATAGDVASRLTELIAESQEEQANRGRTAASPATTTRTASGVRVPTTANSLRSRLGQTPTSASSVAAEQAQRGIIQGKVQIVPDERTNIMIVISDPVNFEFFDRIISVLDRQIEPELKVEVVPLEFADSEEIATILNDMIGAASSESEPTGARNTGAAADGNARSQSLRDFVQNRNNNNRNQNAQIEGAENINQLSEDTKIIADARTNGLLITGKEEDIAILKDVISKLDVMLAQVLIETVILEVNLSDGIEYGVDWLQRSLIVNNETTAGPGGGLTVSEPVFAFGGGQSLVSGDFRDGSQITRDSSLNAGALTYFATFFDFNVDAIVRLAANSSNAKVISSPVLLTTDNTEAQITIGEQRPIPTTSSTTIGGTIQSTFEYRDIGINLTVTPRINPLGFVNMDVSQSADNVGNTVVIDGNEVPIITRREIQATIGVSNKTTIVLGGMVTEDDRTAVSKVPLLGDIPILGNLFRSTSKTGNRSEILILLTPHVLMSAEQAKEETTRLKNATAASDTSWFRGWEDGGNNTPDPKGIRERDGKLLFDGELTEEDKKNGLKRKGILSNPFKKKEEVKPQVDGNTISMKRKAQPVEMPQIKEPVPERAPEYELMNTDSAIMPQRLGPDPEALAVRPLQ